MRGANKYVDIEVEVDEDEDEDEEEAGEAGFEVAGKWRQEASAASLCQMAVWLLEASSEATMRETFPPCSSLASAGSIQITWKRGTSADMISSTACLSTSIISSPHR